MIRHTLVMSLLLVSTQAIATTPCPTCKKGYVASSLEEVLIARQKAKGSGLKKASLDSSFSQLKIEGNTRAKSPVEIIVSQGQRNNRNTQAIPTQEAFRAYSSILETTDAPSRPLYVGSSYFSNDQSNQNLGGTFDRTMAFSTQQQLRQHIQNLKR